MRRRGMNPFLVGCIGIVLIVVATYFGFTKSNPFANPYKLEAAFTTVNDIKPKSPVRIAGVNVGQVTGVKPADENGGDGAIVEMEINDKGLPLHEDMTLKIRPRIFLEGNWFVDLKPGSPSAPIAEDGYVVPVQQTATPVQIGQVLSALQSDTRADIRKVLDEFGRALNEPGKDGVTGAEGFNRSIPYQKEAYRGTAIVNDATLGTEEHDLTGYIRGADRFARGLNRNSERLQTLLTSLAITGEALASEEQRLTEAIAELPRTLNVGRRALGALNTAFPPLRRFVAELRPTVRESGPALDAQLPFLREAQGLVQDSELKGLVRDLKPVVPDLTELNVGGLKLQEQLRLASSCAYEVLVPWRNDTVKDPNFPASGPVFQETVKWLPGIAAESRNFDANGQYVRSLANGAQIAYPVPGTDRLFVTGNPILGVNPPRRDTPPPLRKDVPCETQETPDLESLPQAPPEGVKVNFDAPGSRAAQAEGMKDAIKWLRKELDRTGMKIPVADEPITASDLPRLERVLPDFRSKKP